MAGRAALVALTLAPADPPRSHAAAVRSHLETVWSACAEVGLDEGDPLPDVGPAADDWFSVLATRHGGDRSPGRAFVFRKHDTIGVAVRLLAPDGSDELDAWRTLHDQWATVAPAPIAGLLGASLVFSAVAKDCSAADVADRLDGPVSSSLPSSEVYWPYVTDQGFTMWRGADVDGRRIIAAVAGRDGDELVERWTFWDGERELAGILRCLIYAAKLRYEFGVYRAAMARLRERQQTVDDSLDDLLQLHQMMESGVRVRSDALLDAQSRLSRAETESAGLFISLTKIRELQRTVAIAERNLHRLLPTTAGDSTGASPFEDDLELAQWLQEQATNDLSYADAVRERAREAHALTALRVEQLAAEHARLENQLTLLQTTILGSLLAGLAVIQTLGASISIERQIQLPLVAVTMGLALALPPLIVNLFEQYKVFDYLAAGVLGTAAGWLVTVLAWRAAPWMMLLGCGLLGAALFVLGVRELDHRMHGLRRRRRLRLGRRQAVPE